MNLFLKAVAVSAVASFGSAASAATIVVNDATFGAGSVLRDIDNSTEFLRLDLTMGYGFTAIQSEFGVGGNFEGWSITSAATMLGLGAAAGVTHGATDPAQITIAESLRDFFCPTSTCLETSTTHTYARGLVSDTTSLASNQDAFTIGRRFNVTPNEVDFRISGYGSVTSPNEEVWLSRAVDLAPVPLPAAGWLLFVGIAGLGVFSKDKRT